MLARADDLQHIEMQISYSRTQQCDGEFVLAINPQLLCD